MSTVKSAFETNVMKNTEKDEKTLTAEKITTFVEDARIDFKEQLAQVTVADIPRLEQKLERAKNSLKKAEAGYQTARFPMQIPSSSSAYFQSRQRAKQEIELAKTEISRVEQEIADALIEKAAFEEVLADLTPAEKA